jgi:peptide/nickel transport system permease protein
VAGGGVVILLCLVALFADLLAPYAYTRTDFGRLNEPPSPDYVLGTDQLGRDLLSRMIHGARVSMIVGLGAQVIVVAIGVPIGALSGALGGRVDLVLTRVIDVMYAFPGILLAILIVAVMGPGLFNLVIALTVWGTPTLSRIVRSGVLALKSQEFVEAARAMGASRTRIMFRHLLPNSLAPIIVYATLGVAGSLLTTAGLGFLGLGVQPPTAEWGAMLSVGRNYLRDAPHLVVFPGVLILGTVMSLNLIGDALRDALDPHISS